MRTGSDGANGSIRGSFLHKCATHNLLAGTHGFRPSTSRYRCETGQVAGDDCVAVGVAVAQGELGPLAGQFLAAAFAPGAGFVAAGLVEVQGVAAGVDAKEGEAARVLLDGAYFLLD